MRCGSGGVVVLQFWVGGLFHWCEGCLDSVGLRCKEESRPSSTLKSPGMRTVYFPRLNEAFVFFCLWTCSRC